MRSINYIFKNYVTTADNTGINKCGDIEKTSNIVDPIWEIFCDSNYCILTVDKYNQPYKFSNKQLYPTSKKKKKTKETEIIEEIYIHAYQIKENHFIKDRQVYISDRKKKN